MGDKNLKIASAILFTLLVTIYLTVTFLSLWMLYVISFPYHGPNESESSQKISYWMFGTLLVVGLICSISILVNLYKDKINLIFVLPGYLFLPISIPYLIIKNMIKNDNRIYEIYDDSFSKFLLFITSAINYLFAFFPLIMGITLIQLAPWETMTLYFGIPVTLIALLMIVGTTANIINYRNGSKIANKISYIGFTFVWVYKAYKASLIRNNLYPVRTRERKVKAA